MARADPARSPASNHITTFVSNFFLQSVKSYPALTRLFNREPEASSRFSIIADTNTVGSDGGMAGFASADPWRIISYAAKADEEGLQRGLRWLCILARSGVEIPVSAFKEFSSLTQRFKSSWKQTSVLVEALFCATWLRSSGRQELQAIVSSLHSRLAAQVVTAMSTDQLPDV